MTGKDLKTLGQELRRMERYQELTRMNQENRETDPWANAMHQDIHDSSSSSNTNSPTLNNNKNNNNPSRRHATELARSSESTALPTPPQTPPSSSCPPPQSPPAYTPPPTAQARARARLGYVGVKSSLPNTFSPWGEGTAGTDIDDIGRPAQDRPRPPPYIFHARDRFLETGLPATFDTSSHTSSPYPYSSSSPSAYHGTSTYMAPSHPKAAALFGGATTTTTTSDDNNRSAETSTTTTTPRAPSRAYGVARRVALYSNITTPATPTTGKRKSNNRNIWGGRRRSFRSIRTVDYMLDLERGNPVHKETDVKKYATAVFLAIIVILIFSCTVVYFTSQG
ncbi:uncharacterized protein B0T23DRAFT_421496 [Neurospora hispaniola]|uniref:Uncharacterized protein n=1 Tax=Neurospora hispaniola TaxID=588809 RepID=A0AAJ0MQZ9_9PEZI|nr:hypothetical protein B0T23DRAFT_421496 [Neurospora hispaniola]